ncbi:MAG TPA: outer membrane protein assembly factor BamE [Nitrospinota bacterium]|jgi:outer membrane protein assembly factor BamE (lipoprotein component of BamABCDE complex)|nr:outer membrane protein assembly factor BamE [Nitrospinota bacterium]
MNLKNFFIILFILFLVACGKTGKNFNEAYVKYIKNGETTKQEIVREIGEPNRKGTADGREWWIYEYNTYKLGKSLSKDLQVVFDDKGVVKASTFSSNFP